ncbi:hypothetical protein FSP39_011359 [Pinctada imbricata]|uniref:3'-5' exonuclease domain-containing protein n=1 Tax=Pinctada imbricata TaxID=66713 RepID=A0AA89BUG7_PINIB|nr:hypothetical protein FSP39_011359 [Pinctada imbricata]
MYDDNLSDEFDDLDLEFHGESAQASNASSHIEPTIWTTSGGNSWSTIAESSRTSAESSQTSANSSWTPSAKKSSHQSQAQKKKKPQASSQTSVQSWADKFLQKTVELDEVQAKRKLDTLDAMWFDSSTKDKSKVATLLKQYFAQEPNPFALVIYLIEKSRDFHVGKTTTFAYSIMREFNLWCKKQNYSADQLEQLLSRDTKLRALEMCTRYHTTMYNLVLQTYCLRHPGNNYMLPVIQRYLSKKKYKEAAVCAGGLGLQDHFDIREIALPLVLQDKVNLIETYVQGNPVQQKLLVQLLDGMCDKNSKLDDFLSSVDVPNIKRDKLQRKTLSKLAARLMKLYDISSEHCPNINNARAYGALKYLLYKRFIEGGMGSGSWEEMVMNAIGDKEDLQDQLIEQLMCYNEVAEAVRWTNIYNIPDDRLPPQIAEERRRTAQAPQVSHPTVDEEDWDADTISEADINAMYYQLKLPISEIEMVDSKEGYHKCLHTLSQPYTIVGIDSEWRPSFGTTQQRVGLMQFAVMDHIFLLDIPQLMTVLSPDDWRGLATEVFCNRAVLKLGYGLDSDLKMLVKTLSCLKESLLGMCRTVDLEKLAQKVIDKVINFLPDNSDEEEMKDDDDSGVNITFTKPPDRGLSELVKQCLGKPLNKAEQMSDWERRPLRQPQIIYAALDAYVLIEVYQVLTDTARRERMNIDLEPPLSMKWCKDSKKDKQKMKAKGIPGQKQAAKQLKKQSLPVSRPEVTPLGQRSEIAPGDLRVVVDSMLQGLGRHLRSCGVDVHILDNHQDHYATIEICHKEHRIVLTKGSPFQMIRAHVGEEMCYHVEAVNVREQVLEVLSHFGVKVTQKDIFSRCQVCNGDIALYLIHAKKRSSFSNNSER